MRFKLQPAFETLCRKCRYSTVVDFSDGDGLITCVKVGFDGIRIKKPVVQCSQFHQKNTPTEYEFKEIAWAVKLSSSGRIVGFEAPPKEES